MEPLVFLTEWKDAPRRARIVPVWINIQHHNLLLLYIRTYFRRTIPVSSDYGHCIVWNRFGPSEWDVLLDGKLDWSLLTAFHAVIIFTNVLAWNYMLDNSEGTHHYGNWSKYLSVSLNHGNSGDLSVNKGDVDGPPTRDPRLCGAYYDLGWRAGHKESE